MPKTTVEVRRSYTDTEAISIMDAVHGALVSAFRIPPEDRTVRFIEHRPDRFSCSPELRNPARYTLVTIDCFAGRSLIAKRDLYHEIVNRLDVVGIPPDHITIVLHEIALNNWGIDGGHPAGELDLGFDVAI